MSDPDVKRRRRRHSRPSIDDGAPSLLYTVKQVELAIRHHLDELLKPAGLTALQYTVLTVLDRRDELTLTELAHNSFVKAQSMADILRPLHQRELIVRSPDPHHGRRQLISLAPAGRQLVRDHHEPVRELEDRMVAELSEGDVQMLRGMLARCRTALA
ncbi:MarR family winged helix-turn-helix transcriptional regulator [Lentzea sp. E54]|uniref:MarR family winged helix-turn-helix transcriptional regulator n=1 Tax=Lentzea xerophila TaxID=3435883 RepID=UPI003DA2AF47